MEAGMQQGGDRLSLLQVLVRDRRHILNLHPAVPDILGQDSHRRSHIALPLTSASRDFNIRQILPQKLRQNCL
jgi:hypothetical protein